MFILVGYLHLGVGQEIAKEITLAGVLGSGGAVYIDQPQHLGIWGNSVRGRCNTLFIVELQE